LRVVGLVYMLHRDSVLVAVVEGASRRWVHLCGVHELLSLIAGLREELDDPAKVARRRLPLLRAFANWGRRLIPDEVLEHPPDVLVIVPHDFVHQMPLHLVAAEDGRALAVHSGVSYCSSISLFSWIVRRRRHWSSGPPLAAGGGVDVLATGPDTFQQLGDVVLATLPKWEPDATSLPDSPEEMDEVVMRPVDPDLDNAVMTPDLNLRIEMGRWRVKRILRDRNVAVACLVAHGFVDSENHRDSGLLLQAAGRSLRRLRVHGQMMTFPDVPLRELPANQAFAIDAEALTIAELESSLPPRARLTILLACSAGSSLQLRGDEPGSVAESLLRRGSASVIAPMWDCDYEIAAAWAEPFLAAWRGGAMPVALAVREAFRSLDDGLDPTALGPIHLRGDWQ